EDGSTVPSWPVTVLIRTMSLGAAHHRTRDTAKKHLRGTPSCLPGVVVDAGETAFGDTRVHKCAEVEVKRTCSYVFSREGTHNRVVKAGADTIASAPGEGAHKRVVSAAADVTPGALTDGRVVKDGSALGKQCI